MKRTLRGLYQNVLVVGCTREWVRCLRLEERGGWGGWEGREEAGFAEGVLPYANICYCRNVAQQVMTSRMRLTAVHQG